MVSLQIFLLACHSPNTHELKLMGDLIAHRCRSQWDGLSHMSDMNLRPVQGGPCLSTIVFMNRLPVPSAPAEDKQWQIMNGLWILQRWRLYSPGTPGKSRSSTGWESLLCDHSSWCQSWIWKSDKSVSSVRAEVQQHRQMDYSLVPHHIFYLLPTVNPVLHSFDLLNVRGKD